MKIVLTELIILQAKAVAVMFCAGVLVEILWQLKKYAKSRVWKCEKAKRHIIKVMGLIFIESLFWVVSAVIISRFLYYCSFGRLTLYSAIGFFAGLILWKKLCCVILKEVWVEKEEAANLKTTVRSSISIRPESRGWKKGGQRRLKKKKK